MTTGQGGYTSCNHFAAFANNVAEEDVLDDDTANTIATTINSHMANLSVQTAASLEANTMQINASLQQLATNNAQLHSTTTVVDATNCHTHYECHHDMQQYVCGPACPNLCPALTTWVPTAILLPSLRRWSWRRMQSRWTCALHTRWQRLWNPDAFPRSIHW